jgi:hypothetical protein
MHVATTNPIQYNSCLVARQPHPALITCEILDFSFRNVQATLNYDRF